MEDEAYVEDAGPTYEPLQRQQPEKSSLESHLDNIKFFILKWYYGLDPWVLIACCVIFWIFYQKVIKPYFYDVGQMVRDWRARQRDQAEEAMLKKNPDLMLARMEAIEKVRIRQQELHDAKSKLYAEKEIEKEVKKKADKLASLAEVQTGNSYPKKSLRNDDYNPLMGEGSGSTYRPSRRNMTSGGG